MTWYLQPREALEQAVLGEQRLHVGFGARADMADHLGGADIAHGAARGHIVARDEPKEEASGELITCACGINGDDLVHGDVGALALVNDADAIARTGADDKRTCAVWGSRHPSGWC